MNMIKNFGRLLSIPLATSLLVSCASSGPRPTPAQWECQWEQPAARQAASAPVEDLPLPRVMLIVDEKNLGTIATSEVENLAIRKLQEMKIPIVDQDMLRSTTARGQQLLKMAGDNRGAAALGLQFGAEVVIVGEAVAKPAASRIADSNLRTYQAVATLRAVRTDNAQTIAAASEDAGVVAIEDIGGSAKALRAAAEKSLARLLPDLRRNWTPGSQAGGGAFIHSVEISAGGVDALWKLQALRENLRGRKGELKNVVQRSYAAGMAEFSAASALASEELAETLVLQPPDGLKVQILDLAAGRIQLRLSE